MRRSIATVSLSGTLQDKLRAAARVGFHGVEIFENDLLACPAAPAEVASWANDLGLAIELYQPFRDLEGVPPELFEQNLRRAEAKFAVMEKLGATTILVCSSVHPSAIDDDALAAEQLHRVAEQAAQHNVRVAYEALAWGRHVDDYRHSHRIVAAADHPHLGVCLDSFHILSRGDDPAGIADIPGEKIFFLQLADAPWLAMDVLQWSRHYRCFPGQGGFHLQDLVARVLQAGYRGPLSLEVFNDVFRQADAGRNAVDAMRSLLHLEEALGERLDATEGGAQAHERVELFDPPPAPTLEAVEFVELAAADDDRPLSDVLHALGFSRTGRHRTKPVSLWQQGEVSVLLNANAVEDAEHVASGGSHLAALGLRTDDPVRSGNRADALRAPGVPRRRGVGEVDLPAVRATDGTTLLFCGADAEDGPTWLDDFVLEQPADAGDSALRAVDHLALSLPFERFDEGVLFFRSVLGLRPQQSVELVDTHGMIRSRALTDVDEVVRIALNVPLLGEMPAHPGHGLQHVAFACDDLVTAARAMRDRGLPTLPIPANYYDDLRARFDLPEGRVAAMQELGILYDRTDDGEFLHLFTPPLEDRFFFEVVQRVGGYRGYGAPNAPIRMAAQHAAVENCSGA